MQQSREAATDPPPETRAFVDRHIDANNRVDVDEMLLTVHPDEELKSISDEP
jgi:hypothetical protein